MTKKKQLHYLAHSENTVVRRVKDPATKSSVPMNVPCPDMLEMYNKLMGGGDESDQYISYHKVLEDRLLPTY